jgi:HNH endonuclease
MDTPLHFNEAWLRQKYIDEKLSCPDIAMLVGRNAKAVHDQLRKFGIPTRPRGENLASGADKPYLLTSWGKGRRHTPESRAKLSVAASRPKPWLRGTGNGMSGRTGASNPNFKGGISPERQRVYASAEWKALMRAVAARDRHTCRRCGDASRGPRAIHVHHIKSWTTYLDLRFQLTNVVSLCRACHRWVHSNANTGLLYR